MFKYANKQTVPSSNVKSNILYPVPHGTYNYFWSSSISSSIYAKFLTLLHVLSPRTKHSPAYTSSNTVHMPPSYIMVPHQFLLVWWWLIEWDSAQHRIGNNLILKIVTVVPNICWPFPKMRFLIGCILL